MRYRAFDFMKKNKDALKFMTQRSCKCLYYIVYDIDLGNISCLLILQNISAYIIYVVSLVKASVYHVINCCVGVLKKTSSGDTVCVGYVEKLSSYLYYSLQIISISCT